MSCPVLLIASPLVSYDAKADAGEIRKKLCENGYDVVGVIDDGFIQGYAHRSKLLPGYPLNCFRKEFDEDNCFSSTHPMHECIRKIHQGSQPLKRVFVKEFDRVFGIVTQADLQRLPVRMWIYGVIYLLEIEMGRVIQQVSDESSWECYLAPSRLEKAMCRMRQDKEGNMDLELIDYLELSDKKTIFVKLLHGKDTAAIGWSKTKIEKLLGSVINNLRNPIMHARWVQDGSLRRTLRIEEFLEKLECFEHSHQVKDRA